MSNVAPEPLDCLEPAKAQALLYRKRLRYVVDSIASPIRTMVARGKYDKKCIYALTFIRVF